MATSRARHAQRPPTLQRLRKVVASLAVVLLGVSGIALGATAANAADEGFTLTKSVIAPDTTDIGISNVAGVNSEGFTYQLAYSCSTFDPAGCTNVLIHDALPAGIEIVGDIPSNWTVVGSDVTINLGTIPAGNGSVAIPVRFITNPALAANDTLTVNNTADISGAVAGVARTAVSQTVAATGRVKPVGGADAQKTATPDTVGEFTGQSVSFSVSGTNAGTTAASSIGITDLDPAFFDAFDVTSIDAPTLPAGATSAVVEVSTDGSTWTTVTTPYTPAAHIQGIRVTFDGAAAGSTGTLNYTATLRDSLVSNGAQVVSGGSTAYSNDADVAVHYTDSALDRSLSASAVVTVEGEIVSAPSVTKTFSPDNVIQGYSGTIDTTISTTGAGQGGAKTVVISDPATTGGVTPFPNTLVLNGAFTVAWPAGAEEATLTLSDGSTATIVNPATTFTLPAGVDLATLTGFSVEFESTSGTPIDSAFTGTITAGSTLAAGVANDIYQNNAEVDVDSASGNSSGETVSPTVDFTVATPYAEIQTTKAFTRPTVVLGSPTQSNVVQLRTVYGPTGSGTNVPAEKVVIQDPVTLPTTGVDDFFDEFDIKSIKTAGCATGDSLLVEIYDGSTGAWVTVTTDACASVPVAITNPNAQGVRFTYTNPAGIQPGRTFQPEFVVKMRATNRETGAPVLDQAPPTEQNPIVKYPSAGNCSVASAYLAGSADPASTDTLDGDECPKITTEDRYKAGTVNMTKVLHGADSTDSGTEGSGAAMHAVLTVTTRPSEDTKTLTIQDPLPGDIYSQTFAAVTDITQVGPYTVPQYEQAHIEWLNSAGAVIASSPVVTGGAVLTAAGDPSYAGFRFVLEENPADPGIDVGIEAATFDVTPIVEVDYALRDTFREAVAGHAAGSLVRNNVCYTENDTTLSEGADGNPDSDTACQLDQAPFNESGFNNDLDNINDGGWILNNAETVATYVAPNEDGDTSERAETDLYYQQVFRITNSIANAELTKTVAPDASVSLPDTGTPIGSLQERTINLKADNISGNPVKGLDIVDTDADFWATFELLSVSAPITPAGSTVTYDVTYSDGTPALAGVDAAAITNLSAINGITAHVTGTIPTADTATIALQVRLRSTVTTETQVVNTATVTAVSPFADSLPSDAEATITVRKPGTKVDTSKSLDFAAGSSTVVDTHPVVNATVRTTNSGELGLTTIVSEDDDILTPSDYPAGTSLPSNVDGDFWADSDFVDVTAITPPASAESVTVDYFDGAAWVAAASFPAASIDLATLNATLDGVAVEGLRVTYLSTAGTPIANGEFGELAFSVALNDQAEPDVALTNCAESAYGTGAELSHLNPSCATITPTAGTPEVSVSKVFALTGQPTATDSAGTTQRYSITVTNTGTQNIGSHGNAFEVDDLLPSTLSYNVATANPVITLPATAPIDSTLAGSPTATVVGQKVVWAWPAGQYLAPGESVVIAVSLDVAAALPTATTVTNTAAVPTHGEITCAPGTAQQGVDYCVSTAVLNVNAGGAIRATKSIDGASNTGAAGPDASCESITGFVSNPCAAVTPAGSTYTWKLDLQNAGNSTMGDLVVIDRLPAVGDTGAYLNVSRGTEWRGTPVTAPVASGVPAGVTVGYEYLPAGADLAACMGEVATGAAKCTDWVALAAGTVIPADAQALRIAADYGVGSNPVFAAGDRITITWDETAPENLTGATDSTNANGQPTPDGRLIEWNSFGFSVSEIDSGEVYRNESTKAAALFDSAAFTVTKSVANDTIAPTALFGEFTVDYSCAPPAGSSGAVITGSFVLSDAETGTAVGLPTGSVCTLTEQNAPANFSWSTPDADTATAGYQLVLATAFGTTATTLTNPIPAQSLTITKSVAGEVPSDTVFEYTVICTFAGEELALADGSDYSLPAAGGQIVIDGLPIGAECVVTETNTGGAQTVTISDQNGGTQVGDGITVTIPDGGDQVTITNNFGTNALTIAKDVKGTLNGDIALGDFSITLVCTDPVNGESTQTLTLADGGSQSISGIANGTACTVSEPAPGNKHAHATKIFVNGVESADGTLVFDGTGLGQTIQVVVENNYDTGALTVNKVVEGDTDAVDFTFAVTCTWFDQTISEDIVVQNGLSGTVTGIPVGAECTVVEQDGGQSRVVYDVEGPYEITEAGTDIAVQATNYYEADLTVEKIVSNDTVLTDEQIADLTFTIEVTCTYGDTVVNETFELANGEHATLEGVLVGSDCIVTETDAGGATSTVVTIAAGDADGTGTEGTSAEFVLGAGSTTATVENSYESTALEVTKTVEGPAPAGAQYAFLVLCTFEGRTLDLSDVAGLVPTLVNPASRFDLAAGATQVIGGLPVGTSCDITESDAHGAASTSYTVEGSAAADNAKAIVLTTAAAGDDNVRSVTVKNTFPTVGTGGTGNPIVDLAHTGSGAVFIALLSLMLAVAGLVLLVVRHRRSREHAE
ncbi:DUF5979 domain-containing protein [Agreia sp. PsM10]|uniref:DUF5979 domain-containing protein n=1 Tax=Agreia sp. PsM10 TaxID=3030533 RepID=UPI00263AB154|nr:DUF5979 domain-containing protein [Agreia sp. PsM10]MDN4640509.1 DUF5979 domain-containing protein [Agreia sp. PsM10]